MKTLITLISLIVLAISSGCSTSIKLKNFDVSQSGLSTDGVVMVSAGRMDEGGWGGFPFVNYSVQKLEPDGTIDDQVLKVILGEPTTENMMHFGGHVGRENREVYVHIFELPEGEYILKPYGRGNYAMTLNTYGGGAIFVPGSPGAFVEGAFKASVVANKLNYWGELLTISENISLSSSYELADHYERDMEYAKKRAPKVVTLELQKSIAERIEIQGL